MIDTTPEDSYDDEVYKALVESYIETFTLLDNVYAFTWNQTLRYQSTGPSDQYESLLHYFYKNYKILGTFVIVPELTINGYVHIHGVFTIKDKIKFYKTFMPILKNIGFVMIKPCSHVTGWLQYMSKTISEMIEIMRPELPIPLTSDNVQTYKAIHRFDKASRKLKLQLNQKVFKKGKQYNLEEFFKYKK